MKSAYELALERLEKESGPGKKLTDEQRDAIAEIDKKYDARVAEQRLAFDSRLATATFEEAEQIQAELASTLQSLEAQREHDKESIWNSGA